MNMIFRLTAAILLLALAACSTQNENEPQAPGAESAKKAEKAVSQHDYKSAASFYMDALAAAENPDSGTKPDPEIISSYGSMTNYYKARLGKVYREWARSLSGANRTLDDYETAFQLCEQAEKWNPSYKSDIMKIREVIASRIKAAKFREAVGYDKMQKDRKDTGRKVDILMKQGKILASQKRYSEARDKFEEVLTISPYNQDAVYELSKMYTELGKVGKRRAELSNQERAVEVEWKYVTPIAPEEQPMIENLKNELELQKLPVKKTQSAEMLEKTVLEELNLENISLKNTFAYLEKASSDDPAKQIRFTFEGFDPAAKEWPQLSFKAEKISLLDAVNSICSSMGLLYSPAENNVVRIIFPAK